MRTFFLLILVIMTSFSCSKDSKNPVDIGGDDDIPVANAGPDLTVKVGELAEVDVSRSLPKDKSKINYYDFEMDLNNPGKTVQYTGSVRENRQYFGFLTPGIYKIYFIVATEKAVSEQDTLTITVLPRVTSLIEDVGLELAIRYSKKYATGDIKTAFLAEIDSIFTVRYAFSSLKGIENCTNLKVLNLSGTSIKDISLLSSLMNLEYLDLNQNRVISDITPLRNLVNLKYLNMFSCLSLTSVESLSELASLQYLNLSGDEYMTGFQYLSKLVNLEELLIEDMNEAENGNISFLSNMTKLEKLKINGSRISDISPLKNLTSLKNLDLEANRISDITPLKNLTKLEELNLGTNLIEDIGMLRVLEKISILNLSHNQIEDITPLSMLENLGILYLQSNKIYNIKPIIDNEYQSSHGFINLSSNPLDNISINIYIPKLKGNGVTVWW